MAPSLWPAPTPTGWRRGEPWRCRCGSLIMACADAHRVEAGGALAVDRHAFSAAITEKIRSHPNITVVEGEVLDIPEEGNVIVASGPLTSDPLAEAIAGRYPQNSYLHFFDAAAPLVTFESVDMDSAWFASRYDRGTPDYINCPLTEEEYQAFWEALTTAQEAEVHGFEDAGVFEGCRGLYARGGHGPAGPGYPVLRPPEAGGPEGPQDGKGALRRGTAAKGQRSGLHLQHRGLPDPPEVAGAEAGVLHDPRPEKRRVCALRGDSPRLLDRYYRVRTEPRVRFAGQITGVEGYVESTASGCLTAMELARELQGKPPIDFPQETAMGALALYISDGSVVHFQPMNINFGLIPPLGYRVKGKRNKNAELSKRALEALEKLDLS